MMREETQAIQKLTSGGNAATTTTIIISHRPRTVAHSVAKLGGVAHGVIASGPFDIGAICYQIRDASPGYVAFIGARGEGVQQATTKRSALVVLRGSPPNN
jgi:hypothetical protein